MAVTVVEALFIIGTIFFLRSYISAKFSKDVKAPLVGLRYSWEPQFLTRLRFTNGARNALNEGYSKVTTWHHQSFCTLS